MPGTPAAAGITFFCERRITMTGNQLFQTALDILGLRTASGNIPADAADMQERALSLINLLLAENSALDCRISKTEQKVKQIKSMTDTVAFSDIMCGSVLPKGLAKLLSDGEDDTLAAKLAADYSAARTEALRFGNAKCMPITEVYG